MPEEWKLALGQIGWHDLTIADAAPVAEFYAAVVGWRREPFEGDFNMIPAGGSGPAAGICHARGPNANLPPVWMVYIVVPDVDASVAEAVRRGGTVIDGPRSVGDGRVCFRRDPAGAAFALYQAGP
jgi:uncharacterized protein